ncbi:hemicentin-1-like isoform X2 [Choristoneura fumiferana]|uniref:hemicentin-1-like isoform X2 n=1 Tax=Choristoneura fumiferana TaxID=7141 RepID=UPI003D1558C0
MAFKYLTILFPILLCVTAKKSLTLVIDTTFSMRDEIHTIKNNIGPILQQIGRSSSIENYIIVPFNDPDVGPAQVYTDPDKLIESINALRVSGGHDIPENSLSGLQMALQESRQQSNIFLFTDACAKDEAKFRNVQELCRSSRSRVVIFMSGTCTSTNQFGRIGLYYDVTKVCSGNVFLIDPANLRQAFDFMREITKDDYDDLPPWEPFTGDRQLPVYRIIEPRAGTYYSYVGCEEGETQVKVYKRTEFPFLIGFSPRYTITIKATSSKPLPNRENYILIVVPRTYDFVLKTLILHDMNAEKQQSLNLVDVRLRSGVYTTSAYFEAQKSFRMTISGREPNANEDFRIMGNVLQTQIADTSSASAAATVEIIPPESPLINYEQTATVACKVTGSPKPSIWWEDERGQQMNAESDILEYPSTHISYVSIPNMRVNKTVSCRASTTKGEDSKDIELFVYRPYVFRMIQTPKDATFEYGCKGNLYCQVNAYPDAQINWYHNNSRVVVTESNNNLDDGDEDDDDTESYEEELKDFTLENNSLVINNMTTRFTGEYKCEVINEIRTETFTVTVSISGLESPEIETDNTEIVTNLGDESVEITCRVTKGKPIPSITWSYKAVDGFDFGDIPEDIVVDGEKITVNNVKSVHKGIYKCQAVNDQGQDSREIIFKVHYAPRIDNIETITQKVFEEDKVGLKCAVDADPIATVTWEHKEDDTFVPLSSRHIVDVKNTLNFHALSNDSGTYRCTAENEAGTSEKIVDLVVLVRPYITPVAERLTARVGGSVVLPCNVHASPAVTIEWRFTPNDSPYTSVKLFRGESLLTKDLHLTNLSKAQAGSYLCLVQNDVGSDRINIILDIV